MNGDEQTMKIGALLLRLRKEKGFSEKELARRIGMTDAHINLLENDKRSPSLGTLSKLASALDISVADFFFELSLFKTSLFDAGARAEFKKVIPLYEAKYFSRYSTDSQKTISVDCKINTDNFAAIQMDDDSMVPLFLPGDIVIIDRKYSCVTDRVTGSTNLRKKIASETYVIVEITKERFAHRETHGLLRRIEIHENNKIITLHPLNTVHEPIILNIRSDYYDEHNMDVLYVLGKVVGKIDFRVMPMME